MFFMSLTHSISNLMLIRCYLLFDLYTYFLCIILYHKNLKYKHLIDDISTDFFYIFDILQARYNKII